MVWAGCLESVTMLWRDNYKHRVQFYVFNVIFNVASVWTPALQVHTCMTMCDFSYVKGRSAKLGSCGFRSNEKIRYSPRLLNYFVLVHIPHKQIWYLFLKHVLRSEVKLLTFDIIPVALAYQDFTPAVRTNFAARRFEKLED